MATVLIIDDNETVRDGVATVVHRMGHRAMTAPGGAQGLKAYSADPEAIDVVITDLKMEAVDGMDVLRAVRAQRADAVVILITAHGSIRAAVDAMQAGALDFIEKPFPVELLREKTAKAVEAAESRAVGARLRNENEYLRAEVRGGNSDALGRIVGTSDAMTRLANVIRKVAGADSTVHIHGESGTGKELVATAIHELSPRSTGPFVKVNCGALADTLLESELFGHEKGSFTGAEKRRIGRFELAHEGTLFLDEIGEITPALQVRLLRVLQERTFDRVGGEKPVSVDVRVVTATNRDLAAEVAAGRFREDLFYRLNIIPITIPPLRDRAADIAPLAEHFLKKLLARTRSQARGFSPEAIHVLRGWSWPGNVRELENTIEQALVFADGPLITPDNLPASVTGRRSADLLPALDGNRPLPDLLDDLEKRLILRAYEQANGIKTETARLLGIKTPALYYKLEKYGIGEVNRASDS